VVRALAAALHPDRDRRCPSVEALAALWFDGAAESDPTDAWEDAAYLEIVRPWRIDHCALPTAIPMPEPPPLTTHPSADPVWRATRGPDSEVVTAPIGPAWRPPPRGRALAGLGVVAGLLGFGLAFGFSGAGPTAAATAPPPIRLECAVAPVPPAAPPPPSPRAVPAAAPAAVPAPVPVVAEKRPGFFKRVFSPHPERRAARRD
jgi:hypothetical protein